MTPRPSTVHSLRVRHVRYPCYLDIACCSRAHVQSDKQKPVGLAAVYPSLQTSRLRPSAQRGQRGQNAERVSEREGHVSGDPLLALFKSHIYRSGALKLIVACKTTRPKPPRRLFHCISDYHSVQLFPSAHRLPPPLITATNPAM